MTYTLRAGLLTLFLTAFIGLVLTPAAPAPAWRAVAVVLFVGGWVFFMAWNHRAELREHLR